MAEFKKNIEFLGEAKKLKVQQELLEKHIFNLLDNLNSLFEQENVKILNKETEKWHQDEKHKLNSKLAGIQNSLMKLERSKDIDVQRLKSFLRDINDSVMTIKNDNACSVQKLLEEEITGIKNLDILEKRINDFIKSNTKRPGGVSIWKPPMKSKLNSKIAETLASRKTNKEVEAFQQFLQASGGHTGGWDSQDHHLFLKHRQKLKGPYLEDALHIILPDIPLEAITEHEEWFKQYEILRTNQKLAVKHWREANQKEVEERRAVVVKKNIKETKIDPVLKREEVQKKKLQVKEWKLHKQEHLRSEAQKQATHLQETAAAKQKAILEEQNGKKLAVMEYKMKKMVQEKALHARKEIEGEMRPFSDKKLVALFRERDRLHIARMLERISEAQCAKSERLTLDCDSSSMLVAERDPDRLFRPTKVWAQHVKQREQPVYENVGNNINYVKHLPRLKVPNWRENLL